MDQRTLISSFPFDRPTTPISLYEYAPVLRVRDRGGDWVLNQTGLAYSSGAAIGDWTAALCRLDIDVVAPAGHLAPNPRRLADGKEWVVYPFIEGTEYRAAEKQIRDAGRLLGKMHAVDPPEAHALVTHDHPVVRPSSWIDGHLLSARNALLEWHAEPPLFETRVAERMKSAAVVHGLPLAGCSFDFRASNLIFRPEPVLVDPDHAARMPRLYDLAIALLLFHCDLPSAPGRVWTDAEWQMFLSGYRDETCFTPGEIAHWDTVLNLAWLDQAIWLLGNWPEGWADPKERNYLSDLAALDTRRFSLAP